MLDELLTLMLDEEKEKAAKVQSKKHSKKPKYVIELSSLFPRSSIHRNHKKEDEERHKVHTKKEERKQQQSKVKEKAVADDTKESPKAEATERATEKAEEELQVGVKPEDTKKTKLEESKENKVCKYGWKQRARRRWND